MARATGGCADSGVGSSGSNEAALAARSDKLRDGAEYVRSFGIGHLNSRDTKMGTSPHCHLRRLYLIRPEAASKSCDDFRRMRSGGECSSRINLLRSSISCGYVSARTPSVELLATVQPAIELTSVKTAGSRRRPRGSFELGARADGAPDRCDLAYKPCGVQSRSRLTDALRKTAGDGIEEIGHDAARADLYLGAHGHARDQGCEPLGTRFSSLVLPQFHQAAVEQRRRRCGCWPTGLQHVPPGGCVAGVRRRILRPPTPDLPFSMP